MRECVNNQFSACSEQPERAKDAPFQLLDRVKLMDSFNQQKVKVLIYGAPTRTLKASGASAYVDLRA